MRFRYKTLTQTQLGQLFGVSSHVIGKWLSEVGLRGQGNRPTDKARREGYCGKAAAGPSGFHWVWVAGKTVAALQAAGHAIVADPPEDLIEPPTLEGPFALSSADRRHVLNAAGEVVVKTTSERNADALLKLLNLADRHGKFAHVISGASTTATEQATAKKLSCGFVIFEAGCQPSEGQLSK